MATTKRVGNEEILSAAYTADERTTYLVFELSICVVSIFYAFEFVVF